MCGPTVSKDPKAPIGMTGMAENEVKVVSENQEAVDVAKGSVNEIATNVSNPYHKIAS